MKIVKTITAPDPSNCSGGNCPSFFLTDDGRVLIQGYVLAPEAKEGLGLPAGEDVVSLPASVLDQLVKGLGDE